MSTKARQIVIDTFEKWTETLPSADTVSVLENVRDAILDRLEKETIEQPEPKAGSFGQQPKPEFSPSEIGVFEDEKNARFDLDALSGEDTFQLNWSSDSDGLV
jgi:predicted component of type VI protein secretion system